MKTQTILIAGIVIIVLVIISIFISSNRDAPEEQKTITNPLNKCWMSENGDWKEIPQTNCNTTLDCYKQIDEKPYMIQSADPYKQAEINAEHQIALKESIIGKEPSPGSIRCAIDKTTLPILEQTEFFPE